MATRAPDVPIRSRPARRHGAMAKASPVAIIGRAMKPSPPWTSTDHLRLYRACVSPKIRERIRVRMGVGEATLGNWLTISDVPATKRATVRALLDEVESGVA